MIVRGHNWMYTFSMEENAYISHAQSRIPVGIVTVVFSLLLVSAFAPASWFGAEKKPLHGKIDLGMIAEPGKVADDIDKNGEISWRELAITGLGISPAEAEGVHIEMDKKDLDTLNDPDNLTSSFSKNMYVAALSIQQQGDVDEESKQKIVDQLMAEEAAKLVSKKYSVGDIATTNDNSVAALKKYGNEVSTISNSLMTKDTVIETLVSIDAYTNKGYVEDLAPLKKHAEATTKAVASLKAINVPSTMVSLHLSMLNSYEAYKDTINNLAAIDRDALRSTLSIRNYEGVVRAIVNENSRLVAFLSAKGITYSSKESGYAFMVGYTK